MKEELIVLAKDKKFESDFLYNMPYKYSAKEHLRWYFWLCELHKWLLETHKVFVSPFCSWSLTTYGYHIGFLDSENVYEESAKRVYQVGIYHSYEEALEAGLHHALKLLP